MNVANARVNFSSVLPKTYITIGLVILILTVAKVGLVLNLSTWFILSFLVFAFIYFCFVSPPAVVALFISSHYLIGQVSVARPGLSILSILSTVLVSTLVFVRWRDGMLAKAFSMRWAQTISLLLLIIFMAIGFIRAVQSPYMLWLDFSSYPSLLSLFESSPRNTNNMLHYVFLSHWFVFIAMGVLACVTRTELKTFLVSFSLFYVAELIALPMQFYIEFFREIYVECQAMALSLGNVNRAYLGYLAAMASVISLSLAHNHDKRLKLAFYASSLVAVVVLFLAGSKGPVLAWVASVCFVMLFADRHEIIRSLTLVGVIASVLGVSALVGHSLIPCGIVKQFVNSSHSYTSRVDLAREAIDTFAQRQPSIQPQSIQTPPAVSPPYIVAKTLPESAKTTPELSKNSHLLHVLVGGGFGASTRNVNPETGQVLIHSGSLNLLFDLMVETGVIGTIFFLLALVILVVTFVRTLLRQDFIDRKLIMTAMGGMLMTILVKLMVAAETHTEDLGALIIGLLMGSAVYAPAAISATSDANIAAIAAGSADKL